MKKVNVFFNEKADCFNLSFNKGNGEIVENFCFDSMNDEINELILVKQNEKYYLFGATPTLNWFGFKVDKEIYDKYNNKFNLFENLWY